MLARNHGGFSRHLGLDICLAEYNYHDSLRACLIEGIRHLFLINEPFVVWLNVSKFRSFPAFLVLVQASQARFKM